MMSESFQELGRHTLERAPRGQLPRRAHRLRCIAESVHRAGTQPERKVLNYYTGVWYDHLRNVMSIVHCGNSYLF